MVKKNTCVFISGEGSNLKALIHNSRFNNFPITKSISEQSILPYGQLIFHNYLITR